MSFIEKVRRAKVNTQLNENLLTVFSQKFEGVTHYACYLYVNNEVVIKKTYQTSGVFKFDLMSYPINSEIRIRYYFYDKNAELRSSKTVNITDKRLRLWVLAAERNKFINGELKQLGEVLVKQKQLQLGPFPQYSILDSFNFWEQDPFNNRSWQWRVHWFEFVIQLLAYHHHTKDEVGLDFAQKSIESWWNHYWGKESDFEFIRHDHATALRAEVLLVFYCYICELVPTYVIKHKLFFEKLEKFLHELIDQLLEDSFYSKHTNHGLEQARVLLLLGVFFKDIHAQQIAVERISSELAFSFTEEGIHKENSPGYHQFVLKVFLSIISRFPKDVLGGLSQQFDGIGAKALEFITHILRPDANLPIIGDTELLPATDSYSSYFKNHHEYSWYLYSSSKGRRGRAPSENFKIYPKSGYAIYRSKWGQRESYEQVVQLVLKAGCLSQYHHQQDENNILLYALGEDWLIDSGLYNYVNSNPIRRYARSRLAHNIPIISDTLYDKNFKHRIESWELSGESTENSYLIHSSNTVLKNVLQKRVIEIEKKIGRHLKFIITDEIKSCDAVGRNVSLYWHFPIDKEIQIINNEVVIKGALNNCMTLSFSKDPASITLIKGKINSRVFSCTSHRFGEYEDSQLIKVDYASHVNFAVDTYFILEGNFE